MVGKIKRSSPVSSSNIKTSSQLGIAVTGGANGGQTINIDIDTIKAYAKSLAAVAGSTPESLTPDAKQKFDKLIAVINKFQGTDVYPELYNAVKEEFSAIGITPTGTIGQLIGGCMDIPAASSSCNINCIKSLIKPPGYKECDSNIIMFDKDGKPERIMPKNSDKAIVYIGCNSLNCKQVDNLRAMNIKEIQLWRINPDGTTIQLTENWTCVSKFCSPMSKWWIWFILFIVMIVILIVIIAVIAYAVMLARKNKKRDAIEGEYEEPRVA